jgi:hypothetical protein
MIKQMNEPDDMRMSQNKQNTLQNLLQKNQQHNAHINWGQKADSIKA